MCLFPASSRGSLRYGDYYSEARSLRPAHRSCRLSSAAPIEMFGDAPALKGCDFKDKEGWYVAGAAEWTFWEWGKTKDRVMSRAVLEWTMGVLNPEQHA